MWFLNIQKSAVLLFFLDVFFGKIFIFSKKCFCYLPSITLTKRLRTSEHPILRRLIRLSSSIFAPTARGPSVSGFIGGGFRERGALSKAVGRDGFAALATTAWRRTRRACPRRTRTCRVRSRAEKNCYTAVRPSTENKRKQKNEKRGGGIAVGERAPERSAGRGGRDHDDDDAPHEAECRSDDRRPWSVSPFRVHAACGESRCNSSRRFYLRQVKFYVCAIEIVVIVVVISNIAVRYRRNGPRKSSEKKIKREGKRETRSKARASQCRYRWNPYGKETRNTKVSETVARTSVHARAFDSFFSRYSHGFHRDVCPTSPSVLYSSARLLFIYLLFFLAGTSFRLRVKTRKLKISTTTFCSLRSESKTLKYATSSPAHHTSIVKNLPRRNSFWIRSAFFYFYFLIV